MKMGLVAILCAVGVAASAQAADDCPVADFAGGLPLEFGAPTDRAISKPFGMQFHVLLNTKMFHDGVDFDGAKGLPVFAAASGKVTQAQHAGYIGNTVRIFHGPGIETVYSHLSRFKVSAGDCIRAGQQIGEIGCTGLCSDPHLHFGVLRDGQHVDPEPLLPLPKH